MEKPLKFLVTIGWTSFNKGDAAISIGFLKSLKSHFPNSQVCFLSSTPKEDKKYLSEYVDTFGDRIFNTFDKKQSKFFGLEIFLKILYYLIWSKLQFLPLSKKDKSILHFFSANDVIIFGGGGYFGGNKIKNTVSFLFPILIAKSLHKKTYICAQSVEPFTSWLNEKITLFYFNKADLITVREPYSLSVLKEKKIRKPTFLTGDNAFLIDFQKKDFSHAQFNFKKNNDSLKIGLTVNNLKGDSPQIKGVSENEFLSNLAHSLEKILEKKNTADIFVFPNSIYPKKDDDRIISKKLASLLEKFSNRIHLFTDDYSPFQLLEMIGNMDLFIGMRMHSNIFALLNNKPTIALAYEQKHIGIMQMFGLEKYVIDIAKINPADFLQLIQKCIQDSYSIQNKIQTEMTLVKNQAKKNVVLIEEYLL